MTARADSTRGSGLRLRTLVAREIRFRKMGFALGVSSVAVAMTCLSGAVTVLRLHQAETERLLVERERATREEMVRMEDDVRLIMRDLGYNVMILPADQDIAALQAAGHPDATMPEAYAGRLGRAGIETLNHLLPVLQQRILWPEHGLEVILSGTSGQVPVASKPQFLTPDGSAYRNPIQPPIPPGRLWLGHSVAQRLGLGAGDETALMGTRFVIDRVNPAEGTTDDLAVWCDLAWAQSVLGLEGRISLILALECVCEADKVGAVTREVGGLLDDVRILEFSSRVAVRARARERAAQTHRDALDVERTHRAQVAASQRRMASILIPVSMAGAGLWIFFLFLGNVRERRAEIGILRAVGMGEGAILLVFLLKAVIMGVAGAVMGFLVGVTAGAVWGGVPPIRGGLLDPEALRLLVATLAAAPALCAAAGWGPALKAARQDPALILREE